MTRGAGLLGLLLAAGCVDPLAVPATDPAAFLGPTVIAADPPAGSQGVPLDYPVHITLNEAFDAGTLLAALHAASRGGTPFAFTSSVDTDRRVVSVFAMWPPGEQVIIRLTGALLNLRGVGLRDQDRSDDAPDTPFARAFTAGADKLAEAPRILTRLPADGELGAAAMAGVRFSKRMRPADAVVRFTGRDAAVAHRVRWLDGDTRLQVEPAEPLRPGTPYGLTVESAVDAWGVRMEGARSYDFFTRPAGGNVVINEVVTAPQDDWSDSAGGDGIAFNAVAGTGSVTTSDEYVEIHNAGSETLDLAGWTLEQLDGSNQTHVVGAGGSAVERVTPAGDVRRFAAGCYLVVGNPVGDLSDEVTLVLRDAWGVERDRVSLGGAAPAAAWARVPNGGDTDDDTFDWRGSPATPGTAN